MLLTMLPPGRPRRSGQRGEIQVFVVEIQGFFEIIAGERNVKLFYLFLKFNGLFSIIVKSPYASSELPPARRRPSGGGRRPAGARTIYFVIIE